MDRKEHYSKVQKGLDALIDLFKKAGFEHLVGDLKKKVCQFDLNSERFPDPRKLLMRVLLSKCSWMNRSRPKTGVLVNIPIDSVILGWLDSVIRSTHDSKSNEACICLVGNANNQKEEYLTRRELFPLLKKITEEHKASDRDVRKLEEYLLVCTILGTYTERPKGYKEYIRGKNITTSDKKEFSTRMTTQLQKLKDETWYELVLYLRGENKKESHAARLKALNPRS